MRNAVDFLVQEKRFISNKIGLYKEVLDANITKIDIIDYIFIGTSRQTTRGDSILLKKRNLTFNQDTAWVPNCCLEDKIGVIATLMKQPKMDVNYGQNNNAVLPCASILRIFPCFLSSSSSMRSNGPILNVSQPDSSNPS
jgi:hypothetical protein